MTCGWRYEIRMRAIGDGSILIPCAVSEEHGKVLSFSEYRYDSAITEDAP